MWVNRLGSSLQPLRDASIVLFGLKRAPVERSVYGFFNQSKK